MVDYHAEKMGRICHVYARFTSSATSTWQILFTLPSGFRPVSGFYPCLYQYDGVNNYSLQVNIKGEVKTTNAYPSSGVYNVDMVFLTA